jgi:hypothetical protein
MSENKQAVISVADITFPESARVVVLSPYHESGLRFLAAFKKANPFVSVAFSKWPDSLSAALAALRSVPEDATLFLVVHAGRQSWRWFDAAYYADDITPIAHALATGFQGRWNLVVDPDAEFKSSKSWFDPRYVSEWATEQPLHVPLPVAVLPYADSASLGCRKRVCTSLKVVAGVAVTSLVGVLIWCFKSRATTKGVRLGASHV